MFELQLNFIDQSWTHKKAIIVLERKAALEKKVLRIWNAIRLNVDFLFKIVP